LERPASVALLQEQYVREMHYWLLAGRHGPAIRNLAWPGGNTQRLAHAMTMLRTNFAKPLPIEQLAAAAAMSSSAFYQHFRAATSLSPRQFQKQLRLIEARRWMVAEGMKAGNAAFAVGYESVSQFTREYGRMFGASPIRDIYAARSKVQAVA
jgi:transcriptional regulator GlxA family with amidase domain